MDLYTAIVLLTIAMLAVTSVEVCSNHVIDRRMKRNSILTCIFIGLAVFFEWVGVKTDGADLSLIFLHRMAKFAEFCTAPLIGVTATAGYSRFKNTKLLSLISLVYLLFQVVALPFEWVIRIDGENIYHRGVLYPIYILAFSASVLLCIVSMIRTDLLHYPKPSLSLMAILAFLIFGIGIQMIRSDVRMDYLCVGISNYFLYTHRCKMTLQMDGLTYLLNRRCYEKDLEKVSSPAVILLMDVNNLKMLNDTHGHATGDYYLKEIADLIRTVFGHFGTCYRYGGDEFCAILTKNTERIEDRIALFGDLLQKKQESDARFPSVAVGYALYDDKNEHIQETIREADEMMYHSKAQSKSR